MTGMPRCRLEVDRRCVLALEAPAHSKEALTARLSGTVHLVGTIGANGRVTARPDVANGSQDDNPLMRAALANLTSWWLEPAVRQSTLRITYNYVVDSAVAARHVNPTPSERLDARRDGWVDVQLAFPTRITIRGYPAA
jgi:hypothetical protein